MWHYDNINDNKDIFNHEQPMYKTVKAANGGNRFAIGINKTDSILDAVSFAENNQNEQVFFCSYSSNGKLIGMYPLSITELKSMV